MDKISHSNRKKVFSRLTPTKADHLKPPPLFSQKLSRDPKDKPLKPFSSPFVSLQVTIVNDGMKKRKLNDSSCNSGSSCEFKKPHCLNPLSPDLGCFVDYSSPLSGRCSESSFVPSQSPVNKHTQTSCSSEIKETLSCQLDLEQVKCGSSKDVQLSSRSEKHLKNIPRDFDNDVDNILCLKLGKKEGQKQANKKAKTDWKAVEEDKGYDSLFHPNENKEECNAGTPPEPQCWEQTSVWGQHSSFLNKDCSTSVSQPLLEPVKSAVEDLEGEDDVLIIGDPMFESSVCQPSANDEQRSRLLEVLTEPVSLGQDYSVNDTTVGTFNETTLPLQVQVKSKVVVPDIPESIRKPTSSAPPREQKAKFPKKNRHKIYDDELEWERQKRLYIFSVRSHMTENQVTNQGYMTELQNLMTHVAGQTGSNGSKWQHPSDLTCRNYQWRFCNEMPWMILSEWQAKNLIHHKRFSKVPQVFKRSHFP